MAEEFNCTDCKIGSNCFQKLFPAELEFINQKKTQISYAKGENICKQGAFASYVLYVSSGLVKVYVENNSKKFTNLQILKSSEFIGLSSIYGENIYNYSAVALKDSNICLIEKEALKKLLGSNAAFSSSLIQRFCQKEQNLFNKIKSISYKQMPGRLADVLLYLSSDYLTEQNIFKHLSRKDIADFACISTESTVKLLKEFQSDGIISINNKLISIDNTEQLKEISKRG